MIFVRLGWEDLFVIDRATLANLLLNEIVDVRLADFTEMLADHAAILSRFGSGTIRCAERGRAKDTFHHEPERKKGGIAALIADSLLGMP